MRREREISKAAQGEEKVVAAEIIDVNAKCVVQQFKIYNLKKKK